MGVDYGLDAPGVVRNFAIAGTLLAAGAVVFVVAGCRSRPSSSAWPRSCSSRPWR